MSADFRLKDAARVRQVVRPRPCRATVFLTSAAYGLTEFHRDEIAAARLVACPGCYPTAALLALLPLVNAKLIEPGDIIIDAKSGVSGAGRSLKQNILFSEAGEGLSPYSIASHRHAPEIEQEISAAAGEAVLVNFTPHLVPMSRGELVTAYVRLKGWHAADDLASALTSRYAGEPFVRIAPKGTLPCDTIRARIELLHARRLCRPHPRARHRGFGDRQSRQGFGGAGHPELQPHVRFAGNSGSRTSAPFPVYSPREVLYTNPATGVRARCSMKCSHRTVPDKRTFRMTAERFGKCHKWGRTSGGGISRRARVDLQQYQASRKLVGCRKCHKGSKLC